MINNYRIERQNGIGLEITKILTKFLINFLQNSHQYLKKLFQNSYQVLVNFMQSSIEVLIEF